MRQESDELQGNESVKSIMPRGVAIKGVHRVFHTLALRGLAANAAEFKCLVRTVLQSK